MGSGAPWGRLSRSVGAVVLCPQLLLTKALLGLTPMRTWWMELRVLG